MSEADFRQFRDLIYQLTGISMSDVKRNLVQSRLQRRLRYHDLATFREYFALLSDEQLNADEIGEFVNCVTTNTTSFFREKHHFEFVTRKILPDWASRVKSREVDPVLRIWHAGCSSGEEPYTLSITMNEAAGQGQGDLKWKQLASDIDTGVLQAAASGVYDAERAEDIPVDLRRKYFLRGTGDRQEQYKAKPILREPITFRQINLMDDEWPIRSSVKFDMIWCRNVVIYFDKATQRQLFAKFQQRLAPGGYLFIGHSESLLGVSSAFESLGQTIYRLPAADGLEAKRAA